MQNLYNVTARRLRPVMSSDSPVQVSVLSQVELKGDLAGSLTLSLERPVALDLALRVFHRPMPGVTAEVRQVVATTIQNIAQEVIQRFLAQGINITAGQPRILVVRQNAEQDQENGRLLALPFNCDSGMFDVRIALASAYQKAPHTTVLATPAAPPPQVAPPQLPKPAAPMVPLVETPPESKPAPPPVKDEKEHVIVQLRLAIDEQAQRHHNEMQDLLRRARELEDAKKTEEDLRRLTEEQLRMYKNLLAQLEATNEELKQRNAELAELATRDGLTRLFNHRIFQERLEEEVKRSIRYGSEVTLVLLDIDHFKRCNDTYGHPFGDTVLVGVAEMLVREVREIDIVARYGGEEFAVVLVETSGPGARACCERLRQRMEELNFECNGERVSVTGSFGVAAWSDGGLESRKQLIKRADQSLYHAKHAGRNRVVSWGDLNAGL